MDNDIIGIINPYAKFLPETINNDIIDYTNPDAIRNAYNLGYVKGIMLDHTNTPYAERKFARYNFDFLKDNQEDGQSIYLEDSKYYDEVKGSGKGKRILHYKAGLEIDKTNMTGAQSTGDCVSHAIRTALDNLRCLNILNGAWEEWICRQATCGLYSGRGHNGQGADPIGLSAWACKIGTLLEKVYETSKGKYDFSNYKDYVRWGMSRGRSGMPADLLELTKPHAPASYKVIKSMDALRDVMANGATIQCGSMLSVASTGNPISKRTRQGWNHSMSIIGYDDSAEAHEKYGGCVWFFDNSWGNSQKITNAPPEWQPLPQGCFVISEEDCWYAVRDNGTTAFLPGQWFPVTDFSNSIV